MSSVASRYSRAAPAAPPSNASAQAHNEHVHSNKQVAEGKKIRPCHLCHLANEHANGVGAFLPEEPSNSYPINPILNPHLSGHDITNRFHSVSGYMFKWTGTSTEAAIGRIAAYVVYCIGCYIMVKYGCSNLEMHEGEDGIRQDKCQFLAGELSMLFTLWMAFLAYLFQSFVSAGLSRFNLTNNQIRSTQGRLNEILLQCHSHATTKAETTLKTLQRLCSAFPYVMHAPAVMGGNPDFVKHYQQILKEEEVRCLMRIREGDRVYALLDWMMVLFHRADDAGEWRQGPNLLFLLAGAVERLRGTVGTLIDSLDDAILPFAFVNLVTLNVYLVFILLPIVMAPLLSYSVVPGAVIYYWFLDGMITFVFMVDRPFTAISGKSSKQPLVNLYRAMQESSASAPRRFPAARDNRPSTIAHPEDIPYPPSESPSAVAKTLDEERSPSSQTQD